MRLISNQEFRRALKAAFEAGFDFGELCGKSGDWDVPDFEEWWDSCGHSDG